MHTVELEFHGKKISIETGKIAKQASGAAIVRCGDTMVMVTACIGAKKDGDFLPLTIDYMEKFSAAGRIPGGYFRREGKLSDQETLISRFIDRPCRPLFPEGFYNEVQVVATVMSVDPEVSPDVLAILGASAALSVSEIPFQGPVAGVRVCRVDGKLLINCTKAQIAKSDLHFIVVGTKDAITMVEGGANQVPEAEVLDAIFYAHTELQGLIKIQDELVAKCGKEKVKVEAPANDFAELKKEIANFMKAKVDAAIVIKNKKERHEALKLVKAEATAKFVPDTKAEDAEGKLDIIGKVFEDVNYHSLRNLAFDKKVRIDGRDFTTVRPIEIEVGYIPRSHGSALFQRGETQGIITATLGIGDDAQKIELITGNVTKRFMLNYNFPPYSVGECKPMRGPGRREVGHGALAERAIQQVMPDEKTSPYVVRVVSDITESNGSSSMATVCGASLALMDAGIPIKAPVAGIAMGLIMRDKEYVILTDILGDEDHLGDMDFKVCGSSTGITSMQMDIKIAGLSKEIMTKALEQARVARLHILDKMTAVIATPRAEVKTHAPRIVNFKISVNRIRDLIGSGGKTIKSLIEAHNIKIDVSDDGRVVVAGSNREQMDAGLKVIKALTAEAEVGKVYNGIVKKTTAFGAFVEIIPGIEGLLHISEIAKERIQNVNDVINEGEQVPVKVLEVDPSGKIRLSRKAALAEMGA